MAFYLTLEQVSFPTEDLNIDTSSVDSLSSVVDANVDFNSANMKQDDENAQGKIEQDWMSSADSNHIKTEQTPLGNGTVNDKQDVVACEGTASSNYSASLSTNYPRIPLPVAQYLNETNPSWCTEAEKRLKLIHASKSSALTKDSESSGSMISPFKSMAATTEALALQHSVIGNQAVKPVSADIVAQVVARTQQRLQQQKMNNGIAANCEMTPFDEGLIKYAEANQYTVDFPCHTSPKQKANCDSKVPNVPMSSQASDKVADFCKSRTISVTSISSKKGIRISEHNMPLVHTSQRSSKLNGSLTMNKFSSDSFREQIGDSETESCVSEKFELESICSDAFETESNISEVSGLCEEMYQVRKLLEDNESTTGAVENGPVGKNDHSGSVTAKKAAPVLRKEQSTETETSELFELQRANANLEGRLESILKNEEDFSKERSSLQSMVSSLQAQIPVLVKQCEQAVSEKNAALKKLEFLNSQENKWDNVIKEYQSAIESKNAEINALKEDLSEAEQTNIQARINCEELKVDIESKEGAISGLKQKITELHVEVQVLLQSKVQLQNEVKNARHEIEMLQKSKEWYQEQLHLAQESRNKLQKDLASLQSDNVALNNQYEKSKTELKHLQQQLSECQQRAVSEKEVLMKHLETIEADMAERESLFDQIQKDKGSVEDALLDRAKRMEEERSKLTHLMFTVSDLEYQLSVVKSDISEKDRTITSIEKEKAELCRQVALLQKTVNDKDLSVQQQLQKVKDANSKTAHLEATLKSVENLCERLKEEKNITDMSLASANEEKCLINETLGVVRGNLQRVENNFKQMKADLVTKTAKVTQLLKEKTLLEDNLKKLEDSILNQQKQFQQQISLENQNCSVMVGDLKKQKHDIENVLEVYSSNLFGYQQRIQALEQERKDLKNEITRLNSFTANIENEMKNLDKENSTLRESIASLQASVSHLESTKSCIKGGENGVVEDHTEPHYGMTSDYQQKLKVYKSNIKVLVRQLKEKKKQCESQVHLIKQLKEELALGSSSNSKLPDGICEENSILELQAELENSRKELKEERNHVEENQRIIIELEKEMGKMAAILESSASLKLRISELESLIAEKEATVSQLSGRVRANEAALNDQNALYQSRLNALDEDLKKERALVKGLRQQVFQEKRANSHNQRQLSSLKSGLEQANQTADARKKELTALQSELEAKRAAEIQLKAEIEKCQTEILVQQAEIKRMEKELKDEHAKDPALAQQIKSLSWHLKQKNTEIAALKETQNLLEERHRVEVEGLKKSLQAVQSELKKCKEESEIVRKQKFQYQSQLTQLRRAFRSNLAKLESPPKLSSVGGSVPSAAIDLDFPGPESSYDESYVNKLLETSLEISESRPLHHLQACLNSLKQEMAELQKQISENAEQIL